MDILAQQYGDDTLSLFLINKQSLTEYTITFDGNIGITKLLGSEAALLSHLQTYFNLVDLYDVAKNFMSKLNIQTIYSNCLNMAVDDNYTFLASTNLYYYNLITIDTVLISEPIQYDSRDTYDIFLTGTLPSAGATIVVNGFKLGELGALNLGITDLMDGIYEKFEDIPTLLKTQIYGGDGYKMTEFVIERWSTFELLYQDISASSISSVNVITLPADEIVGEFDDYIIQLELTTLPQVPLNKEGFYFRIDITIDGLNYSAFTKGNPVDTVVIYHNPRNRNFLRAVYNKFRTFDGTNYLLNVLDIRFDMRFNYI